VTERPTRRELQRELPEADTLLTAREAGLRLHHFHGGLRLRHNKKVSCQDPVLRLPLPARLVVPLLQHVGEPGACLVTPGQTVCKGELIARAAPGHGAHVHAPTSGTVIAVEPLPMGHPSGLPGPCVVIAADGHETWAPLEAIADWQQAEPEKILPDLRCEDGAEGQAAPGVETVERPAGNVAAGDELGFGAGESDIETGRDQNGKKRNQSHAAIFAGMDLRVKTSGDAT